jgi:regulator of RNase E activity RraA
MDQAERAMPTINLADVVRGQLGAVSTATLTTALFKRGLRNTFIQGVKLITPSAPRMIGPAYTLRYIPAREDIDHIGVFEDPEHPQRLAVESIPVGCVLVMDARRDRTAATAGGILVARMHIRGAAGVVTDGCLRDTPEIAKLPFPIYAAGASAPTNLIRHHAVDINVPVGCGGVAVYPGDILVGDAEGVVVIPAGIVDEITQEAIAMTEFEDWAEGQVHNGRSIIGLYPPNAATRAEYRDWRGRNLK